MKYENTTVYHENHKYTYGVTQIVKWLLISNLIIFLVVSIGAHWEIINLRWFYETFGQVNSLIFSKLKLWQFFTSLFIHGNVIHLVNNMIILWMFGTALEKEWGCRPFLIYYFVCGIGAGLLQFCVDYSSSIPGIGASGAIFGVLGACGLIMGNRDVYVLMAKVKLKYIVALITGIELYLSIMGTKDGIGHWTHISGFVIGIVYIKLKDYSLNAKAAKNLANKSSNKRFDNIEFD